MAFAFLRPDRLFTLGAAVSSSPLEDGYPAEWLVDGRAGWPIRSVDVNFSATVTGPAAPVDTVVVAHHRISAGQAITVTGDVTGSLAGPPRPPNDIALNPVLALASPVSVSSLSIGVSGNGEVVIIGELFAGQRETLAREFVRAHPLDLQRHRFARPADLASAVPPRDRGQASRRLQGSTITSLAGRQAIEDWYDATRDGQLPTVIIPDLAVNDAWVVRFTHPPDIEKEREAEDEYVVTVAFEEWPARTRW